jgi:uncharacterized glyoxalase superfamily protein PhnB
MTDHGTPEGYTRLTPFLCVSDGAAAISFYTEVFGAELVSKMELPTGGIAHAELQFATGRLQLADAMPEYELAAPDDGPLRLDPRPARPSLDDLTRVQEVSPEEGERRLAEWSASSLS